MSRSLLKWWRKYALKSAGVSGLASPRLLGGHISGRRGVSFRGEGVIEIGAAAWIESGVNLHAFGGIISLGDDVFLGPHTVIYGHGGVEIGDSCIIAMHCRILSSNHAVPLVGTDIRSQPDSLKPTKIGRDVWLGAGVTVLGGVSIGDGCVVGAGSVVTKDLPAGAISYGIPAQIHSWRDGVAALEK